MKKRLSKKAKKSRWIQNPKKEGNIQQRKGSIEQKTNLLNPDIPKDATKALIPKSVSNLTEVIRKIKEQQIKTAPAKEEPVQTTILQRHSAYNPTSYNSTLYNPAMLENVYGASTYSSARYSFSKVRQEGPRGFELSNSDLVDILEDSKLRSMGLGSSGKHIDHRKIEVYNVIKMTTSYFAMSQVLYRLALS